MPNAYLESGDAYLALALSTSFDWIADVDAIQPDKQVALVVRKRLDINDKLPDIARRLACFTSSLYDSDSGRIAVLITSAENLQQRWPSFVEVFDAMELASPLAFDVEVFDAMELALPLAFDSPGSKPRLSNQHVWSFEGSCVVGCIDDGFPVQHPLYQTTKGHRLLRYWDQNALDPVMPWEPAGFKLASGPRHALGYGRQLVNPLGLRQPSPPLDTALMASDVSPVTGSRASFPPANDETDDVAYHLALGLKTLRHSSTHGAHVLDALAGPMPAINRVSPDRVGNVNSPGHDGKRPSYTAVTDAASSVPLVLVQLPQHAVDDASGRWLAAHVLDGIHYILAAADKAQHVVINISWGPQTGPHDGSSLLEQAMDQLVTSRKDKGQQLDIVLPAGNSALASAYARLGCQPSSSKEIFWVVPPGQRGPAFVELWWPETVNSLPTFTVTPPGGPSENITSEGWQQVGGGHVVVLQHQSGRYMALLAVPATGSHSHVGVHGKWLVSLDDANTSCVDVYVARTTANMGGRKRGPQSYLLPIADGGSQRQAALPVPKDPLPPLVKGGALNGIATGQSTIVVGGTRVIDGQPVDYGSQPVTGKPSKPAQESKVLSGLLTGAVRVGTVARLNGTSIAAPQHARDLVNARGKCTPAPTTAAATPSAAPVAPAPGG